MSKQPHLSQSEVIEELPAACADELAARAFFERKRWPNGPCCPHCGDVDVYRMVGESSQKRGLLRCRGCKKQFSVRTGTVYQESLIPLHKWARAFWEAATCKNGVSALELMRKVQVSYKTSLFMLHRIRFAMASDGTEPKLSGICEADETYVGGHPRYPQMVNGKIKRGPNRLKPKIPVFAVVQRGGDVRASVMTSVTADNISRVLLANMERTANLMTDESTVYTKVGRPFASHNTVHHRSKEYVNKENPTIHSNTSENFFSRVKRQLTGTYHAVSPEHLFRYISHAEFLYNSRTLNDGERVVNLIQRADGKRLMYHE